MYALAKNYYEHKGNLKIKFRFKTSDGFTPDENGKPLGIWIFRQKSTCSVTSERGILLSQIGMIWDINKNKEDIKDICLENNIDVKINKNILSHISIQELQSKIEFLKAHNMPIVNENGILNDIFFMSSPDMKEKYGISLAEIINEYYIEKKMKKGV